MNEEATIGARLRTLRRWRGMTQVQLAGLAGLSQAFLSQAERGQRALDRRSHIAALAAALRVSETDLTGGPHLSADPVQSEPHATIPGVRAALMTNTITSPVADRARPLTDLTAEMVRIDRIAYKPAQVGKALAPLIDELHVHVCAPADEAAYRLALETLIEAFHRATLTTKELGYTDLAHIAAMRAMEAASILGDPVSTGKALYVRTHAMPATSRDLTLAAAEDAANALQPHAQDDAGVQVLGMLTLAAALSAAVVYNYGQSDHWLDQATELAGRTSDAPGDNWGAFSATNVDIWRIALATERGEGGTILDLAKGIEKKIDEGKLCNRRGRHAAFLADVGRGLARERKTRSEAVRWLRRAEDVAPQKIRNNTVVRHTLEVLREQALAKAVGVELRGMMARMGIPH